jgi:CBS domain-containing protein
MIALRKVNLYKSQPRTTKDSPVHARLLSLRCGDVIDRGRRPVTLHVKQSIHAIADTIENAADQDVFPVLDDGGKVVGLMAAEAMRSFVADDAAIDVAIVADAMVQPLVFGERDDVRTAALALVRRDLRAAPVLDAQGTIAGMIDEHDIMRALSMNPNESQG